MAQYTVYIQGRGPWTVEAPSLEVLTRATEQFSQWIKGGGFNPPTSVPTPQGPWTAPGFGNPLPQVPNEGVPSSPERTRASEMQIFGDMLSEATRWGRPFREKAGDWTRDVGNALTLGNFNEMVAGVDQLIPGGMNFQQRLGYEDQQDALHRAENPVATTAIDVAGGLATGGAMMKAGLSPMARARPAMGSILPAAALEGAAYGAVAGVGQGSPGTFDLVERGRNAFAGAAGGLALGAGGGAVGGTLANRSVVRRAPTNEALRTGTDAAYGAMRGAGVRFSGNSFDNIINTIDADLQGQNLAQLGPGSATQRYLNWLHSQTGQAPTMDAVDQLRRSIRDEARDIRNGAAAQPGNSSTRNDARLLERMADHLNSYMMDPLVPTVAGGANLTAAQASLLEGRQLSLQQRKSETIQEALSDAMASTGLRRPSPLAYQQAVASQFSAFIKDPARMGMYSTEEQAILRQLANGNVSERTLANLGRIAPGSLLSFPGLIPTVGAAAGGYAVGGIPGAAGALAGGELAGRLSAGMTRQNVALVDAMSRAGGAVRPLPGMLPLLSGTNAVSASQFAQNPATQNLLNIMLPPRQPGMMSR